MLARHRLIVFPNRIWNVVQCRFVAIHSIRFPSHGHKVDIGNIDVTANSLGIDEFLVDTGCGWFSMLR